MNKKSEVDGDVMGALHRLSQGIADGVKDGTLKPENYEWQDYYLVYNALIAQSDPEIVRIPRKVLDELEFVYEILQIVLNIWESENREHCGDCVKLAQSCEICGVVNAKEAINDVLNYKADEQPNGEGE